MKRRILLLLSTAIIAFAAPAAYADQFLLGFTGFDYHLASPTSTHYLDVGDGWRSLGFVTSVDPGLLGSYVDFSVNEYTYYMNNLTVATTFVSGNFLEADFSNTTGARTRYYEDPISGGTHGTYGVNPPNGTAPSTFTDGTIALGGKTYNFVITYDSGLGQGDFSGNMDLDEGVDLIYIPSSQRNGWILGGLSGTHSLSGPPNPSIPAGYDHQVSGECRRPEATPTTHQTWGAIKALYR
jgi:hypothetical protein